MTQQVQKIDHYRQYARIHFPFTSQIMDEKVKGSVTLKFVCRNYDRRKNKLSPIYLQAFVHGKQVRINSGISIDPSLWDRANQCIRGRSVEIQEWNRVLSGMRSKAIELDITYRLRNTTLTANTFRDEMLDLSSRINFLMFYRNQAEQDLEQKIIKSGTHRQHLTSYERLKKFQSEISFGDLNPDFTRKFSRFMEHKMSLKPDTILTTLKNVKRYVNIARRKGISFTDPFEGINLGSFKSRLVFLTKPELQLMLDYFRSEECTDTHRTMLRPFLMSCHFGGMRYGDWSLLKKSQISHDLLRYTPSKTAKYRTEVYIPLNELAYEFIDDNPIEEFLFPKVFSEPYVNRELKVIAAKCGIHKRISTHTARHTFGSLFYQATKNLLACSRLMGHTSVKQTMMYAHIDHDVISQEMKAYSDWAAR
jgi:integrase